MLRFTLYTHRNKYDSSGVFVLSPADLNRYGGVLSEVCWPQPVEVKTKAGCSFFNLLGMKRNGGGADSLCLFTSLILQLAHTQPSALVIKAVFMCVAVGRGSCLINTFGPG